MVSKILHITCMVLLAALAVLLCINSVRALNSGYEKIDFKVYSIYSEHINSSQNKHTITIQAEVDDKLIQPANQLVTNRSYQVGETIGVWYNPETNMVAQHFMTHIVMNFIGAALSIACIIFTFPRKQKTTGG